MNNPLKQKRKSLRLSREEIAKKVDIKVRNIKAYETNESTPNAKDLLYICTKGYDMTYEEIMSYLEYLNEIRKE